MKSLLYLQKAQEFKVPSTFQATGRGRAERRGLSDLWALIFNLTMQSIHSHLPSEQGQLDIQNLETVTKKQYTLQKVGRFICIKTEIS